MPYIEPQGIVHFLRSTGLSPSQQHTYRFETAPQQRDFFKSFAFAHRDKQSYRRVNAGVLEVNGDAPNFYSVDYIMFNNNEVVGSEVESTRWYYAFVTNVEYVDNDNVRIYYKLDDIQTWMIPVLQGMRKCYILRQHSARDGIYENTQADEVDIGGEYQHELAGWENIAKKPIYNPARDGKYTGIFANWYPCIARPFPNDSEINVMNTAGIPTPINVESFHYFSSDDEDDNTAFRNYLRNMPPEDFGEVVDMFMYPEGLISTNYNGKTITEECEKAGKAGFNPWAVPGSEDDPWTPKNKKMYTYPYCFLTVTNNCGVVKEFKYEYFNRELDTIKFDISGTYAPDPEFYCAARGYNNIQSHNAASMLTLSGVPKIPWITDAYKVYMSQNAASVKTDNALAIFDAGMGLVKAGLFGVGGLIMNALEGDFQGAAESGVGVVDTLASPLKNIARLGAKYSDARKMTDNAKGTNAPNAMYLDGMFGFSAYHTKIPKEYARRVDDFWTMYGYPVNAVGKIDIFSRPHWNYIQAINVSIPAECTPQARIAWESALSAGITFWNPGTKIGSYSLDNSPT